MTPRIDYTVLAFVEIKTKAPSHRLLILHNTQLSI